MRKDNIYIQTTIQRTFNFGDCVVDASMSTILTMSCFRLVFASLSGRGESILISMSRSRRKKRRQKLADIVVYRRRRHRRHVDVLMCVSRHTGHRFSSACGACEPDRNRTGFFVFFFVCLLFVAFVVRHRLRHLRRVISSFSFFLSFHLRKKNFQAITNR